MVDFVSQLIPDDESDASQNSTLDSSLDDDEGGGGGAAGQKVDSRIWWTLSG
jgi:hypothetical protein